MLTGLFSVLDVIYSPSPGVLSIAADLGAKSEAVLSAEKIQFHIKPKRCACYMETPSMSVLDFSSLNALERKSLQ